MNKKGQVLVTFILLLPLMLLFLGFLIELGNNLITKRQINNTLNMALEYVSEDHNFLVKEFIEDNIDDCDVQVKENDNIIKITVSKTNKSIFNNLLNTRLNKIRITKTLNLNEESEDPYGD